MIHEKNIADSLYNYNVENNKTEPSLSVTLDGFQYRIRCRVEYIKIQSSIQSELTKNAGKIQEINDNMEGFEHLPVDLYLEHLLDLEDTLQRLYADISEWYANEFIGHGKN